MTINSRDFERNLEFLESINNLKERISNLETRERAGVITGATSEKTWAFSSLSGSSGTFYFGGFYHFGATDDNFSPSINFGTANAAYGGHVFVVLGEVTVDELTIRVTGTSVTDSGTRTAGDSEDIVIPNGTAIDSYFETVKKFIGQVTIELISGTAKLCNYGQAKYWDNDNTDFTISGVDVTWVGGANDSTPDIQLIHHKDTGWTYNAGAEPTPPTPVASMAGDYVTEIQVKNGEPGAWKRTNLSESVEGSGSEGTIIAIVTTANKAFEEGNFLLRITA